VAVCPVSRVGEVASLPLERTERSSLPAFSSPGVANSPDSTPTAHSLCRTLQVFDFHAHFLEIYCHYYHMPVTGFEHYLVFL